MSFRLCPHAPHGPRDCGMVAVQVDAEGYRWTCTACYEVQPHGKEEDRPRQGAAAPAQTAGIIEAAG